ncbi:DUF6525 family protein [Planktotalea sp.]|uniref:DUF6525 family protein n=1 Tax=Planktotalea sp. TaxID=2029877 RepID=UPI003297B1D5
MNKNLGNTSLRRKRRAGDPMHVYDTLPTPLRQWLSQAALPWSPASARKIWARAQAKGLVTDTALAVLKRAEINTLARDKCSINEHLDSAL